MIRKRVWFALGLLFNFLLPWAIYRLIVPSVGETHAIIATAVVPALWSLVQLAWNRKVGVMSVLVLSWIALSLTVIALGGSPKVLLFRSSLITGLIGLVLLGSAMIGRPLMVVLFRAILSQRATLEAMFPAGIAARASAQFESLAGKPWFQRLMTMMTIVFGLVAVAETVVLCAIVFSLPTERVLLIRPIVRQVAGGLLMLWMFVYVLPTIRRSAREDEREDAEMEDASQAAPN